jgi:ABC-type Zn2+ transport system substrate-binding protein/surface adhesin
LTLAAVFQPPEKMAMEATFGGDGDHDDGDGDHDHDHDHDGMAVPYGARR